MNTESALRALEKARESANRAQIATSEALEAIARFYDVMGDDTWNDLRAARKTQLECLSEKVSLERRIDKHGNTTISFKSADLVLFPHECAQLARQLLKEAGVTK